jgi:hypothetical protein
VGHETKRNDCENYVTVNRPVAGPKFTGMSLFILLKSERMGVEAALSGCIWEVSVSNLLLSHAARTTCGIDVEQSAVIYGKFINCRNGLSDKSETTVRLSEVRGLPKSACVYDTEVQRLC